MIISLRPSGREFSLEGSANDVTGHNSSGTAIKTKFARKVQEFILRHGLDGVDLDWEFFRDPKDQITKKDALLAMVKLFRAMFHPVPSKTEEHVITVTTSKYPRELTDNYDFANLHK